MTDWPLPLKASCLCGQVKMTITAPPICTFACHCRACQKLTGGAYSLTLMLPATGLKVEGETEIGGLHRPELHHHFCTHCKNWLYTDGFAEGLVNMRPTLLEDASWFIPYAETMTTDRLPGAQTGAQVSFDGFPGEADFPALMEGFARHGARPG
ncbi:MAG: aldehyde-activating protein [Ponticaulis sp.]|nr:aldehyde-activating protein [Ponticaulis sp.]